MTTYRVLRASDDVIAAPGQTVTYDPTSDTWVPTPPASGGASSLADLSDVDTTGASEGEVLVYDEDSGRWTPAPAVTLVAGAGISITTDAQGRTVITATGGTGGGITTTTATPPTFDDDADTYIIPTRTGVDYYVDGVVQTPGVKAWSDTDDDVIVTAQPQAGYALVGDVSWVLNFTEKSTTTALSVTDNGNGTVTLSGESVTVSGDGLTATITDPTVMVSGDGLTATITH